MGLFDKFRHAFQNSDLKVVRIDKTIRIQTEHEINTDIVWFQNHNIEQCIKATEKLAIEHIHLQTDTLDFLNDKRLKNVKGISIQQEIEDLTPLYNNSQLTHLGLPENIKIEFDFSKFPNLIDLGGTIPKKYINLDKLINLKYTYLFEYWKKDFKDFSNCKDLRKLWIYSLNIENLKGLSNLNNLTNVHLENCRKLKNLDGISSNINIKKIILENCKNLVNADDLGKLTNLKELWLRQVLQLDSLKFLNSLDSIEEIVIYPTKVGVKNNDYYPLVETLQRINKLENLKGWKPLKQYLEKKFIIEPSLNPLKSELELIKENLSILDWTEKIEDGLTQYSKKNCKKAESIILKLINQLEQLNTATDLVVKEQLIKNCVLELNKFNDSLDGSFIETGEREELCDIFDNIADAVGINVLDFPDGIASKWREW